MPTLQTLAHLYVPPVELVDTSGALWPKWIYPNGSSRPGVIVQDEAEESAILAATEGDLKPAVLPNPVEPIISEALPENEVLPADASSERDSLIALASERGVKIDKRWKIEKIKAALEG